MITFHSTSSNPGVLLKFPVQSARLNQPCELCVSDFVAILKLLAFKHFVKAFIFCRVHFVSPNLHNYESGPAL
ncbi:MAG: hypothetical protein QG591_1842 [Planctomycetota bacterium]|nr:hypothetical protein [Planctomycetota bacterium]